MVVYDILLGLKDGIELRFEVDKVESPVATLIMNKDLRGFLTDMGETVTIDSTDIKA